MDRPTCLMLTAEEARVLGCLMEKAVTTPDNYPLSRQRVDQRVQPVAPTAIRSSPTTSRPSTGRSSAAREEAVASGHGDRPARRQAPPCRSTRHCSSRVPEFASSACCCCAGAQTPGELKQRTERWHRSVRSTTRRDALQPPRRARTACSSSSAGPARRKRGGCSCSSPSTSGDRRPAVMAAVGRGSPRPLPTASRAGGRSRAGGVAHAQSHSLEIRNPATGEVLRSVAVTDPSEIEQKVARARRGAAGVGGADATTGGPRSARFAICSTPRPRSARSSRRARWASRSAQSRNEVRAVLERIDWNIAHVGEVIAPRTVTRRRRRRGAGHARARRRGRAHQRVELPVLRRAELDRPGAAHRQRRALQAVGARDAHRVCGSSTCCTAPACRSTSCTRSSAAGATGAALVDGRHRHGVLHRLVRDRPARRTGRGRPARARAARARRQGRGVRVRRRRRRGAPRSRSPRARSTTAGSRAAPSNGSTCTRRSPTVRRHARRRRRRLPGRRSRPTTRPMSARSPRAEQLDVLDAQVADAVAARRARCCAAATASTGREIGSSRPCVVDVDPTHGDHARRELRSRDRRRSVSRDDAEAIARMDDTEFGLGASVFTRDRARAERILAAARRRQRLLEHGRPLVACGCRGPDAATPASACRCRSRACATFVREKAWHLKSTVRIDTRTFGPIRKLRSAPRARA